MAKLDLYMEDLIADENPALDDARNRVFTWKANFQGILNLYYDELKKKKMDYSEFKTAFRSKMGEIRDTPQRGKEGVECRRGRRC